MQLKITPNIDSRYWIAIMIASMCGTNFGDVFPDVLKTSIGVGLALLTGLFTVIVLADRVFENGKEAFYWLAILTVRAAATLIADFFVGVQHLSYLEVSIGFSVLLATLIGLHRGAIAKPVSGSLPPTDGYYWFTMLTAGALGTVIGDCLAHAFGPVEISIFISIAAASTMLTIVLAARCKLNWTTAIAYWVAVVVVRWWGTNLGDLLAHFITKLGGMAVTGALLILVLHLWKSKVTTSSLLAPLKP